MTEPSAAEMEKALLMPAACVCTDTPLCVQHKFVALALHAHAKTRVEHERDRCAKTIPTNWMDPLLSGTRAALQGNGPWGCPDIERLLRAIVAAIRAGATGEGRDG